MLKTARIIPIKMSQTALGPEPKTIGNGPTKITTPTLPEPPTTNEETTKTTMPMKTNAMPKITNPKSLLGASMPSASSSSAFLNILLTSKANNKLPWQRLRLL